MDKPHNKPSVAALHHWREDQVTKYVMNYLEERFRALKPHQSPQNWDDSNIRVGQQQVIYAINKLCDGDPR